MGQCCSVPVDWLQNLFSGSLSLKQNEPKPESLLTEVTFEGIVEYIKSGKCKKIVTMAGAGISTCKLFLLSPLYEVKE